MMSRSLEPRRVVWILGLAMAAGVVTFCWLCQGGHPTPTEHPVTSFLAEPVRQNRAPAVTRVLPPAAPAVSPASHGQGMPAPPALRTLLHARDPYAAAVQARQSGVPGGFFAAEGLVNACQDVLTAPLMATQGFPATAIASGPLRSDIPAGWEADEPPRQAARLAALHEAQARCATLWANRRGLHEPHLADRLSQSLLEESRRLGDVGPGLSFASRRAWLQRLHSQQAWLNPDYVQVFSSESYEDAGFFDGQPWGGASSREAYERALRLAGWAYGFDAAASQRSLATLAVCVRMGACEGRVEDLVLADLSADSALRREVLALYPRLLEALRRGDIDAFATVARKPGS